MPRVRIKETVISSSDTSGFYSNYAVLITGFTGREEKDAAGNIVGVNGPVTQEFLDNLENELKNQNMSETDIEEELKKYKLDKIQPDSNGVYEFTSADDFKKTIGLKGPVATINEGGSARIEYHYGNQMAYELLKLGYPIVYKPIKSVLDMNDENFWEIFKDKVNYDFRFISHGLLASVAATEEQASLETEKKALLSAQTALQAIRDNYKGDTTTDNALNNGIKDAYEALVNSKEYDCLLNADKTGALYVNFTDAESAIAAAIEKVRTDLDAVLNSNLTTTVINNINGHIARLAFYAVDSTTNEPLADVGRGDCIALIELDEQTYLNQNSSEAATASIVEALNEMTDINDLTGGYCALTVPSVLYKMTDNNDFDKNKKFPAAFHYLACFMNSLNSGFKEWYAAAGYTRGTASYIIDKTTVKLGEVAINTLEPRTKKDANYPKFSCNVITNFRGSYYLWGNRTALELEDESSSKELVSSHFLNIRQLCTTVKKQLQVACRRFTFDPSSDTLWFNFVNAIKPTLEAMKADQGIRDYKIIKESVGAQKAAFKAKIRIIPIEAVEDFDLEVSLEDSFNDIIVNEAN